MANQALIEEKVKTYLLSLSPQARKMFLAKLETAGGNGLSDAQRKLFLSVARSVVRERATEAERADMIMRAFFRPVEPFLYDGELQKRQRGRIARASLERIWGWISRDVAPDPLVAVLKGEGTGDIDDDQIEEQTAQIRAETLRVMRSHLKDIQQVPRGKQRLAAQLGGGDQMEDLEDLIAVLSHEREFASFFKKMPARFTAADFAPDGYTLKVLKAFLGSFPKDPAFIAAALLDRLPSAVFLVAVTKGLARADSVKKIDVPPYRAFIDVLLSEVGRLVMGFTEAQQGGKDIDTLTGMIDRYHELVRALDVDIQIEEYGEWSATLAAARRKMSDRVGIEIEPAIALVRRILRVSDDASGVLDVHMVADATRALHILTAARRAVDSLALNDLQSRTWRNVRQSVETLSYGLLERVRAGEAGTCDLPIKKLDAAIDFSRIVFDEDYAYGLQRTRNNAVANLDKRATGT
ncbi:hypothetical protein GGD81_004119 [Rhodobium orientis]|uniref:Uncharacterized protein n=1 Tax=Rhodobium orientis TaxID=34017 RepID=A0A327JN52_9HYPH|nr:hypothetical protein [Rhodobium orientis]MBB4305051.1 hypothetical protein [Rhodobium orientis]MBK5949897.1 hypothetical protein [Rhodobium orientis]RAI24848.1 hypothetical protein CH339_20920 [Rhodobium orientis]